MRIELYRAQWDEEALTTWRASLATRDVVVKNRHCGRLDSREDCVTYLENPGKTLEAITEVFDAQNDSLQKDLSNLHTRWFASLVCARLLLDGLAR